MENQKIEAYIIDSTGRRIGRVTEISIKPFVMLDVHVHELESKPLLFPKS
jgi:sporulation protein YlmC with PRC-barrel domain